MLHVNYVLMNELTKNKSPTKHLIDIQVKKKCINPTKND